MLLLSAFLAVLALVLAEFSWKCLIYYSVFFAVSLWLVHLFLVNKCELDFEVVFKFFEWIGYGSPRFLDGRTLSTSESNTQEQYKNKLPKPISDSVEKLVNNVLRDFVKSWYEEVADGEVFVLESRTVLNRLASEVYHRMNHLDSHYLVEQVILVFHSHLVRYNKSISALKEKDPNLRLRLTYGDLLHSTYESQIQPKHIALTSAVEELNYLRTVVDTLLAALTPRDVFSCDLGRFILREILAVQAVELIDLLCDPNWVNEAIVDLLTPPESKNKQLTLRNLTESNLKSINGHLETSGVEDNNSNQACEEENTSIKAVNETTTSKEEITSEVKQVCETEGRTSENSDKLDNTIIDSSKDGSNNSLQKKENLIQFDSTNNANVNKPFSNSSTEILSQLERQASDQEMKSSLASSWGFCPSAQDTTFHTESFEAMKAKALKRERQFNSSNKVKEFGSEVKKLGSCCTSFEVSEELYPKTKGAFERVRCRSLSMPGELQNVQDHVDYGSIADVPTKKTVTRSISFPTNMSSALVCEEQPCGPIARPVRSSTFNDPSNMYGSPYQNLSFCSSEASFKSFSDGDLDLEEGEEMDEGGESDTGEILENIAPLPIMKPPRRKSIARQAEVVEDGWFGSPEKPNSLHEYTMQAINGKISENGFDRNKSGSQSSKDSDSIDLKSPSETSPTSPTKLDTDQSFGDSVIMAGRKFISSIRSPVRKFGFSSSSSKSSTSMSSGADSMEVNVPSSIDAASFDSDLPLHRPVKFDSPNSGRKLSRSHAVFDISSESDTETWYGTPTGGIKEEIVYGGVSNINIQNGNDQDIVRIHPSQMISIPSSETAFESDWEPGRNKFTLYRIEYDIRIWPSVYASLLELDKQNQQEGNDDNSKEQQKRSFHHRRAIKRRYREFMELHSRLSSGPLALFMKDILKPNRKYNLPFGRLDKDVVEGRRSLLQYYLVSLVSKPELRDSHELQQFLGVIGGGSFIKPSVAQIMSQSVHVPRVDKMLSRQMTKVIDSIKTAFDSDEQEGLDSGKVSPVLDIGCPWSVECHGDGGESDTLDENQVYHGDYFSAFLENLELSKPSCYYDNSDTESSFSDSSSDSDAIPHIIDPAMANDRTDIPNQPSTMSSFSEDDMLNGVLGSKPPGLCINPSYSYSATNVSSIDGDAVDFGNLFTKKDTKASSSTDRSLGSDESAENIPKSSSHRGFSKKHVEKIKTAAKKAKEKKAESLDSLNNAKEKVKKKIPSAESLENLTHAKEKVKAFKKNVESMENLNQAKEKVKSFKRKIPDVESMENLSQAKEKVKAFKRKIPDAESLENITHAKEKVKAFKKNVGSMDNLSHAKEKVKAFKKKIPDAESMENLTHAKEKVKAFKKKIPHPDSSESIAHAKDKVKELKKKIPNPQKLIKKDHETVDLSQNETSDSGHVPSQIKNKPEKPSLLSTCDVPSEPVCDVAEDIFPDDPQSPLAHAIMNLTCEVLKGQDSWAGLDRVQEGFKGTFGALFEWFVRSEIDDVLTDECWSEYLEELNEVVWPNGKLIEPADEMKSEEEQAETKKKAVQTLMEFFPDIFQLLVGSKVYHECAANAVESLQNPAINRILIYILLELFLSELVPELQRSIYTDVNEDSD